MKLKKWMIPLTATLPAAAMAQQPAERPNIMVILVDDMGYSDLGCFGGEINTPNLDGMAENGVRFTQFFNCGRSCPSRASLMTGMYAQQAGINGMGVSLSQDCVTIPEVLREAGYRTAMTGKWHLSLTRAIGSREEQTAWLAHQNNFNNRPFAPIETYPCNRGFEEHWGTIWGVVDHFDPFSLIHNEEAIYQDRIPEDFYSTDFITEKTIDLLDDFGKQEAPFFMYVAYNAPHWPLHAKPEDIAKYEGVYDEGWEKLQEQRYERMVKLGIANPKKTPLAPNESGSSWEKEQNKEMSANNMEVHAAMVDCVDQGVGRILQKLKDIGEYDNTIIIFTSDNGASPENYGIGEFDRNDMTRSGEKVVHNAQEPGSNLTYNYLGRGWAAAVNTPYRYWKAESFHGGIASAAIVQWPAGLKAKKGSIIHEPCHQIDVMPTCLELAETSHPETYKGREILPLADEARSLMPLLNGKKWSEERVLFWEHENGKAVRKGKWKLTALRNGEWQLFDMEKDISETKNVADKHPEIVVELQKMWNDWAEDVGLQRAGEKIADTSKEQVCHYTFDESLADESGRTTMTQQGGSFVKGKKGMALSFNGSGDFAELKLNGVINPQNTQFTICAWVYNEELGTDAAREEVILTQKDKEGVGRMLLYLYPGEQATHYGSFLGGRPNTSSADAVKRGEWHHIAVTYNPADRSITYYVDGKVDATVYAPPFEKTLGDIRIGSHKTTRNYWHGKLDDLYIFRGILSPKEIRRLRAGKPLMF